MLIYGFPGYYQRLGFRHAKGFGIANPEGKYPVAHLAMELYEGALRGMEGRAFESEVYQVDEKAAQAYDALFEPKTKIVTLTQKRFAETAASYL